MFTVAVRTIYLRVQLFFKIKYLKGQRKSNTNTIALAADARENVTAEPEVVAGGRRVIGRFNIILRNHGKAGVGLITVAG